MGERFKIVKDDYPVVMMFVQKEGQEREEFKFVGEFKNENLKSFIRQNTGIYLPLAGCIEEFDHMADKIVNGGDVVKVLKDAEDALTKLKAGDKNKRYNWKIINCEFTFQNTFSNPGVQRTTSRS